MNTITIGGDELSRGDAEDLVEMFINDCREVAGVFHGMNRSVKFRANWPDENVFAHAEWRNFVEATRIMYAEHLGDPWTTDYDKRRIHLALVLWQMVVAAAPEYYGGEQILPGSQKFDGEAYENRRIGDMFGNHSTTFADLAMPHRRHH